MMSSMIMTSKRKIISGLLILISMFIFNIIISGHFENAEDDYVNAESGCSKCYKSITLEYGDTLWGIASEYKGDYCESVQDYIDEVMSINNLKTDKIHAGQCLTIPYYATEDCYNNEHSTENEEKLVSSIKKHY